MGAAGMQVHPRRDQYHEAVGGALAAGAAVVNGVAVRGWVAMAGAARFRIRIKTSGNGTLAFLFSKPGQPSQRGVYAAGEVYGLNPATVAITGGTEGVLDVAEHFGEHGGFVQFTPSADGTITHCDVMRV